MTDFWNGEQGEDLSARYEEVTARIRGGVVGRPARWINARLRHSAYPKPVLTATRLADEA